MKANISGVRRYYCDTLTYVEGEEIIPVEAKYHALMLSSSPVTSEERENDALAALIAARKIAVLLFALL